MLLAGMTRLPEGAVGNDLLSGRAAAAAKSSMLECRDRKTDIPDTHCLTPPPSLHCHYDTRDCTHLRLADSELGTSKANVLFHSFSFSFAFSLPFLPLSYCRLFFSVFPRFLSLSPSVSLFLSHLLLRLETSNRTFGQPLSSWQVLK